MPDYPVSMHKFTVILFPCEEGGYQVFVPNYPEVNTWGKTPEHAFAMAKECLELLLEVYAESHQYQQVIPGLCESHVVIGEIEAEVPDVLLEDLRAEEAESRKEKAAAAL